jgi:hypothetical protein
VSPPSFKETRLASNNTCYMSLVSQSAQWISCPRISLTTNIAGGLNAFLNSRPLEMRWCLVSMSHYRIFLVPHVTCDLRNLILGRVPESTSLISTKYSDSALSRDLTIPWDDRARVKITMDLDVLNQPLPRIGSGTGTWRSCGGCGVVTCDCPD